MLKAYYVKRFKNRLALDGKALIKSGSHEKFPSN
jgi:hypothetical protein